MLSPIERTSLEIIPSDQVSPVGTLLPEAARSQCEAHVSFLLMSVFSGLDILLLSHRKNEKKVLPCVQFLESWNFGRHERQRATNDQ